MGGSVLDVVSDVALLAGGLAIAWMGWESWRRPGRVPVLMADGPLWVARGGSFGWMLLGVCVASLGGYALAGREDDWPLSSVRWAALALMVLSPVLGEVLRTRRRGAGRRRPRAGRPGRESRDA
ncbi:hypothetical protein [Streptomyces sp. cmx-18-6]|uniref:hypothetical protein n=1 Tax=Streptomyces sp. cmx-18-6 TaxID=2790930 RepID=UPI003980B47E